MVGQVHVYTGNGKGKTTAALGLALRAAGAGWNVFLAQFAKGRATSELAALDRYADRITVRQYGRSGWLRENGLEADARSAEQGLAECAEAIASGDYRLVILDEANVAAMFELFPLEDLLAVIDAKPPEVELVITGRDAHRQVLDRADLITEMREVKHYYREGVLARAGIES